MSTKNEYKICEFDKPIIIKKIIKLLFEQTRFFLSRTILFDHPTIKSTDPYDLSVPYIRLRHEDNKNTITTKTQLVGSKFEKEIKTDVKCFDSMYNILLISGLTEKTVYEKIQEDWISDDGKTKITFNTKPGEPESMKIESDTEEKLKSLTTELNLLDFIDYSNFDDRMQNLYGFSAEQAKEKKITFQNVESELGCLVIKNKDGFHKLVVDQLLLYNNLINKYRK